MATSDDLSAPSTGSFSVASAARVSLWSDQLPASDRRPRLDGNRQVDVAIVGGGYSGLWTAWYLAEADPSLSVLVIEAEHCGFGASGRNGGWAVGELAGPFAAYARRSSPQEAMRLNRAMFDAVDEIGRVAKSAGIDCDYAKGGTIRVARTTPQARRQAEEIAEAHAQGFTEGDLRLLGAEEARSHLAATEVRSGIHFAHTAALHPARLAAGLATAVEAAGVSIVENTRATSIGEGRVTTDAGMVTADTVVLATEAYTCELDDHRRDLLPVYSLMVATEPLEPAVFDEIGLADRPTFADDRHMVIYGQRTGDDRIAFGGRGVPYLFGSRIDAATELHEPSHELIRETLVDLLPILADTEITHRWGGVLGIPRDWVPGLRFDPMTRSGVLGGYVGEGVAAANLAGRTMADLVVGNDTERTSLPWVGVRARRWEPEPLRWLGVRSSRRIMAMADDREQATDREARLTYRLSRLLRGA